MTWKLFGDLLLLSHLHFYIPHTIQKNTRNIRQIRFDSRLQCIYKARHTKAAFACPIYVFLSLSLTHAEDLPVIFVLQYHIQQGLRPVYFTLFACCASRCKEQINKSRKSFASCEMLMKYRIYAFSVSFYSFIYIFFFFVCIQCKVSSSHILITLEAMEQHQIHKIHIAMHLMQFRLYWFWFFFFVCLQHQFCSEWMIRILVFAIFAISDIR